MSLLSQVNSGKIQKPVLAIIYGPDGVGKSTFAADAPKPIFIDAESGTANLNVARFPKPENYDQVLAMIKELIVEKHDYQTLAIDSLDWIETMVHQAVCDLDGSKTINKAAGGYGNGPDMARSYWKTMIRALDELQEKRKMNIVLIAHSQVKTFNDPTQNLGYDRYQLKLADKSAEAWREFVETVLFANFEVIAKKEKSDKMAKTYGDGARKLYTERRPSFDAKNRLGLPFELPLDWKSFVEAAAKGEPDSVEAIMKDIVELEPAIKNEETKTKMKKAVNDAKGDVTKLTQIRNHARTIAEL